MESKARAPSLLVLAFLAGLVQCGLSKVAFAPQSSVLEAQTLARLSAEHASGASGWVTKANGRPMKVAFVYVAIEAAAEESMILNALYSLRANGLWNSTAFVITDKPECFSNFKAHLSNVFAGNDKSSSTLKTDQGSSDSLNVVEDGFKLEVIYLNIHEGEEVAARPRKKMSFHDRQTAKTKHIMRQIKVLKTRVFELIGPEYTHAIFTDTDVLLGAPLAPFMKYIQQLYDSGNYSLATFPDRYGHNKRSFKMINHKPESYHTGVLVFDRDRSAPLLHDWTQEILSGKHTRDQHALLATSQKAYSTGLDAGPGNQKVPGHTESYEKQILLIPRVANDPLLSDCCAYVYVSNRTKEVARAIGPGKRRRWLSFPTEDDITNGQYAIFNHFTRTGRMQRLSRKYLDSASKGSAPAVAEQPRVVLMGGIDCPALHLPITLGGPRAQTGPYACTKP